MSDLVEKSNTIESFSAIYLSSSSIIIRGTREELIDVMNP